MPKLTEKEKQILAYTLLGEAAGEGRKGMEAVAWVIRNRSESGRYPSDPASVALQANKRGVHQFSTWNGQDPTAEFSLNSSEGRAALDAIDSVFGESPGADPTRGALSYYANDGDAAIGKPYWFDKEARAGGEQIGNHIFAARVAPVTRQPFDERAQFGVRAPGTYKPGDQLAPLTEEQLRNVGDMDQNLLDLGKPAREVVMPRPAIDRPVLPKLALARGFGNDTGPGLSDFNLMQEAFDIKPTERKADTSLINRPVRTVDIDEVTGLPTTPAKAELSKTQSWRNALAANGRMRTGGTTVQHADGTTTFDPGAPVVAGDPLPAGVRPISVDKGFKQIERTQDRLPTSQSDANPDFDFTGSHYEWRYGSGKTLVPDNKPRYTTVYETQTRTITVTPKATTAVQPSGPRGRGPHRRLAAEALAARAPVTKTITVRVPKRVRIGAGVTAPSQPLNTFTTSHTKQQITEGQRVNLSGGRTGVVQRDGSIIDNKGRVSRGASSSSVHRDGMTVDEVGAFRYHG